MKKIILIAGVALASCMANASYLYWQVSDDALDAYNGTAPAGYEYDGGIFKLRNDQGTYYNAVDATGASSATAAPGVQYYSDIGTGEGYSYFVEMYNNSGSLVATASASAAELQTYVQQSLVTTDLAAIPSVTLWHVGGFSAVPEPTSGLMLLLGAAMLGLRRKNRSVA